MCVLVLRLCRLAEKILLKARDEVLGGDEEQAYVLYMRFIDVFQSIRNSKTYKTEKKELNKLLSPAKASKALDEAERLSKSLRERFVITIIFMHTFQHHFCWFDIDMLLYQVHQKKSRKWLTVMNMTIHLTTKLYHPL
jgi:hypothetical protein